MEHVVLLHRKNADIHSTIFCKNNLYKNNGTEICKKRKKNQKENKKE